MSLGWSHYPESFKRDIPRGAGYHMDVAMLRPSASGRYELDFGQLPTSLDAFFSNDDEPAKYMLDVQIVADNARPNTLPVVFTFDPAETDLKVTWRNRSRYPFYKFWKRWLS